ncbi:arginase family protein [Acetobacter pomorum]|nr:arginase family protein [Acetobacter sp. JWB]KAA8425333.1 arginase family protein [Acetobacter pomorum]KAA8433919.1 arginase family protein [Acetobacter pomorum]KAA8448464.1 arginase family protein [Acetobacter pomorum]KGB23720.1 Arginase [Acetobacter pomorum]
MADQNSQTLRLIFPQWQGGDNPPYYLGSKLLAWLAPPSAGPVEEVPVDAPTDVPLPVENEMRGRSVLLKQIGEARTIIERHQPKSLAVLWIDTHPDVQTPKQYMNAHAHVLGALLGHGDPDLTKAVTKPVPAKNVMIAGIHDPLPFEAQFIADHGLRTCSPQQVRDGAQPVMEWLKDSQIEVLAIHLDLDVLDPHNFRSLLFAKPGRGKHDFGDVAEGKLNIPDVLKLIQEVTTEKEVVGMTIAEHMPWDALNLQEMLKQLPLIGS